MSDWEERNGNFEELTKSTMETHIGRWMYFWIVKRKDEILSSAGFDENPLIEFENLHQAMNPRKKEEAYTWHGTKSVAKTDKDGKSIKIKNKVQREEKEGDWPIKKYVTVNGDAKKMIVFLLTRYIWEVREAYRDNGNSFSDGDSVLSQIAEYSFDNCEPRVSSALIAATDPKKVDVDKLLPDNDFNSDKFKCDALHNYIKDRVIGYFKDGEDSAPSVQIGIIVAQFIRFLKLLSVLMAESLWVKKQTVGADLLRASLRQLYVFLAKDGEEFSGELEAWLKTWVEACKEAKEELKKQKAEEKKRREAEKAAAAEAGDDGDDDGDDDDGDDGDLEDAVDGEDPLDDGEDFNEFDEDGDMSE